jgi:hypothetical protein
MADTLQPTKNASMLISYPQYADLEPTSVFLEISDLNTPSPYFTIRRPGTQDVSSFTSDSVVKHIRHGVVIKINIPDEVVEVVEASMFPRRKTILKLLMLRTFKKDVVILDKEGESGLAKLGYLGPHLRKRSGAVCADLGGEEVLREMRMEEFKRLSEKIGDEITESESESERAKVKMRPRSAMGTLASQGGIKKSKGEGKVVAAQHSSKSIKVSGTGNSSYLFRNLETKVEESERKKGKRKRNDGIMAVLDEPLENNRGCTEVERVKASAKKQIVDKVSLMNPFIHGINQHTCRCQIQL